MFDNIIIFTYLVETGSFTQTAELLHYSQATVSKKLIELEDEIGERLFIRDTRNLKLLPAGMILYNKFKSLRQDYKQVLAEIRPKRDYKKKDLILCLSSIVSYEMVCPYLKYFLEKYPEINIDFIFYAVGILIEGIDFDIGLSNYDLKLENYNSKLIRRDSWKLYCTSQYAVRRGIPRDINELKNHYIIGALDNQNNKLESLSQITMTNRYTGEKIVVNSTKYTNIRTNLASHAKQIGIYCDYIFWCWEALCESDVRSGKLIPILPEYDICENDFYLIYKKDLDQAGNDFCDFLCKCMEKKLDVFSNWTILNTQS